MGLEDTPEGIQVTVNDTSANGDFVQHDLALLERGVPHTIKFWIKLNHGRNNDLVRIYYGGRLIGPD